jgi:hypothetical protein
VEKLEATLREMLAVGAALCPSVPCIIPVIVRDSFVRQLLLRVHLKHIRVSLPQVLHVIQGRERQHESNGW